MKLSILILLITGYGSAFANSTSPDLMLYERLGNGPLLQQRIGYGLKRVALSASLIPSTVNMMEAAAQLKGATVSEGDKKAAACALTGMLVQEIGSEVSKFAVSSSGLVSAVQKTASEAMVRAATEATAFCGLAGPNGGKPATTLKELYERVDLVKDLADAAARQSY